MVPVAMYVKQLKMAMEFDKSCTLYIFTDPRRKFETSAENIKTSPIRSC